jgi:hypothetical protein
MEGVAMTELPTWALPFIFTVAAADVVVIGLRFRHAYPMATLIVGACALAGLGGWYLAVRHADGERARRAFRAVVAVTGLLVLGPWAVAAVLRLF